MTERAEYRPYVRTVRYNFDPDGFKKLEQQSDRFKNLGYVFVTAVSVGKRCVAFYKLAGSELTETGGAREYPAFMEQEGSDEEEVW